MPANKIFRATEATDLSMRRDATEVDATGMAKAIEAGIMEYGLTKVLFSDEESGLNLTYVWFKPHHKVPRHSHDADCLYYIIAGSMFLGNQELTSGDGVFVPATNVYKLDVGPDGAEFLELRTATAFNVRYGNSESSWDRYSAHVADVQELWSKAAPPPLVRKILDAVSARGAAHKADASTAT